MGPTAGSGGLGLIVGVLEGAMGDLVGLRAFPGVAHDDVVRGGWVNRRIFFQILAISLVAVPALNQQFWTELRKAVNRPSKIARM